MEAAPGFRADALASFLPPLLVVHVSTYELERMSSGVIELEDIGVRGELILLTLPYNLT